jgi:membrane complex biogenesis BtpA family protein
VVGIVSILVAEFAERGPCGVNLLRNAARDAVAAAVAGGGRVIRVNVHTGAAVTDQGLLLGAADETVRYLHTLRADIRILADVQVKHAAPLVARDITVEAQDCCERGLADGVIVTGPRTGAPADLTVVKRVKTAVRETPVFVGSGVSVETVAATLAAADGVIVSTSIEKRLGEIDAVKAKAFVAEARRA